MSNLKKERKYCLDSQCFDSLEELEFKVFLNALREFGLIEEEVYQPESFKLFDSVKIQKPYPMNKDRNRTKESFLMNGMTYTCDWFVKFSSKFFEMFPNIKWIAKDAEKTFSDRDFSKFPELVKNRCFEYYFDVKGVYDPFYNGKVFSICQKIVYEKYGIYVNKIVPNHFFKMVLKAVPEKLLFTKTGKISLKYRDADRLESILSENVK